MIENVNITFECSKTSEVIIGFTVPIVMPKIGEVVNLSTTAGGKWELGNFILKVLSIHQGLDVYTLSHTGSKYLSILI
ncbi:hypothetical protein D3C77_617380 [compost metagenome]